MRWCHLFSAVDTIAKRDCQFPGYAMGIAVVARHSPSRCLRKIGAIAVILGERHSYAKTAGVQARRRRAIRSTADSRSYSTVAGGRENAERSWRTFAFRVA